MPKHLFHSVVLLAWGLPTFACAPEGGSLDPSVGRARLTWNLTAGFGAMDCDPWDEFAHRLGARFALPKAMPGEDVSPPVVAFADAPTPARAQPHAGEHGAHGAHDRRHLSAMVFLLFWKASAGTR